VQVKAGDGTWQHARVTRGILERRAISAGFLAATIILLVVGWESDANTKRLAEDAAWQNHTYEVLNALGETAADLDDAETGQRGYLLTGQDAYLEPYNRATASLGQVVGHLKCRRLVPR
jgi:CHASE3 domain sensor protein